MNAAICMTDIQKHYDHFKLQEIDLTLPEGEIMGLVGVNGAGKSTILRILMGLVRADGGQAQVLGHVLPHEQVAAKRDIGYAAEDMRLYKSQTLRWHMDFIRSIYLSWDETYANELLRRFDLVAEQKVGGYSHGQRVKALLLLNLARRPKLLLLDEPTTGLDPMARVEVLETLAEILQDDTRSVLFSSHNTRDVEQLSDSITFLHQGRILACQDKESYIEGWRRLLCQGHWPSGQGALPEVVSTRQNGSLVELKVRNYDDAIPDRLQALGLEVKLVEAMNLEDIFVTTVRSGEAA